MNKNAIKKFAIKARTDLINLVQTKASFYGITEENYQAIDEHATTVNGKILTSDQQHQRSKLLKQMRAKDFTQVIEEVAYTWFNRFCALRFMEVNGYLPSHIRVFTDEDNNFKPQILTEAINLDSVFEHIDMQKVFAYKQNSQDEDLFKYLLILQCNELNTILPKMFQPIEDYTELLLPDNLLRADSVIGQMVALIPQEDWQEQVQIIGWLYQYYIAEPKDILINAKKQYKKNDVPFVTQLFTSDWIVRYMVENSLGRLWLAGHSNDELKANWQFYLDEAKQEDKIEEELAKLRNEYAKLNPTDIKCIDPCMGSGHILCYLFDVLMQIYESYGYTSREAVKNIIETNLWGLDIDERAVQLSYFTVMMKARQYDRRFFNRKIQPHIYVIDESNDFEEEFVHYFVADDKELKQNLDVLLNEMNNAKTYGSIIHTTALDFDKLYQRIEEVKAENNLFANVLTDKLLGLINVAKTLSQQYDIIVTNPPYMNSSYMPSELKKYVQKKFPDFKSDIFAVFTYCILNMCKPNGQIGLLMPYVWMFISSYEKMRKYINDNATISSLVQLEYNAFEGACVPVAPFTLVKSKIHFTGEYIKLSEFKGAENQAPKTLEAIKNKNCGYRFTANQDNFAKIPGLPIAYWWKNFKIYDHDKLSTYYESAGRNKTHNNGLYVRLWWEISNRKRWQPYANGGAFRRWFGNNIDLVDWSEQATKFYASHGGLYNQKYRGTQGICWNLITSYKNGFRVKQAEHHYSSGSPTIVAKKSNKDNYILAFLNSTVAFSLIQFLNPTLNTTAGDILSLPIIFDKEEQINSIVEENIAISKNDWDSFETSWDFKSSPLVNGNNSLQLAYEEYKRKTNESFTKLKANEEALNKIFIDIYGLQDELSPEVEDKDITVAYIYDDKADIPESMKNNKYVLTKQDVVKQFISYAVGCMFGRYSLDKQGLAFAGGEFNLANYQTFLPDTDNIIPISDDEYFKDDIVDRFIKFLQTIYGEENLENNLNFIANALDAKTPPRQTIRNYFIKDFYKDHLATYKKTPIYWLFDAGKKNSFKCLIYIHRYTKEQIARIRTDYIFEQQSRYRFALENNQKRLDLSQNKSEKIKLDKTIKKLKDQSAELHTYEEKIHHLADQMLPIDLDNGIKHNYTIFKDVLAKLK